MKQHPPFPRLVSRLLLSMALILGACAPLQQAPLVYTSGVTVGVKIGVAPTQADGFETVIGFKMLDAAYVPVAVSKPDAEGAIGNKAPVHEIYGQFGEELTPEAVRQLKPEEMESVKSYLNASAELADKKAVLDKAQASHNSAITELAQATKADDDAKKKVEDARKLIFSLKDLSISGCSFKDPGLGLGTSDWSKVQTASIKSAVEACVQTFQQGTVDANTDTLKNVQVLLANNGAALKMPAAPSPETTAAVQKEAITKADTVVADAKYKKAKQKLEGKEKSAMDALQKLANIRKRDALSVYGSFNGTLNQGTESKNFTIGSKLGKVFSTGVAAQNLTEAAKIGITAEAFSQCVSLLKDLATLLDKARQEEFIQQAIVNCGTGAKNTTGEKKAS